MGTKTLSSLIGDNALPKLAPDLASWSDRANGAAYVVVSGIDATAGLTTLLSLTGKFLIDTLFIDSMGANNAAEIKLTIDGVIIWNETGLSSNSVGEPVIGKLDGTHGHQIRCDSSLLLEIKMTSDNDIELVYQVRPII